MLVIAKSGFQSVLSSLGLVTLLSAFGYGMPLGLLINSQVMHISEHSGLKLQSSVKTFDPNDPNIDPALARDFVLFVNRDAFDSNPVTQKFSRNRAQSWMKPEARNDINNIFWRNPVLSKQCLVEESAESLTKTPSPLMTVRVKGYLHYHGFFSDTHYPISMTCDVVKSNTGLRLQKVSYP